MTKLQRPQGLIRYDSLNGLAGKPKRWWRPRLAAYVGLWLCLAVLAAGAAWQRRPFEATLMRQTGMPYFADGDRLRNAYVIHVVNKTRHSSDFDLSLRLPEGAEAIVPVPSVQLKSLADIRIPISISMRQSDYRHGVEVIASTRDRRSGKVVESRLRFLGP
jgi:polyferredoxin